MSSEHRVASRSRLIWEAAGIAGLVALAVYCLAVSWRRWPDPTIDFGRELYLPWRLAQGAVLYRDVDDFYGPLSQYLNAGLFRVFGPGLMVLVTANLAIFGAIAGLLYTLFRRAWGVLAALVAVALFVAVFGFAQYLNGGCYTYAAPYAHEATHGLLVCLILAALLTGWMERPTAGRSGVVGLLFGLTLVLKAEFILPAAAILLAAGWRRWRVGSGLPSSSAVSLVVGALLPTAVFLCFFASAMPWSQAWQGATRAWWTVVSTSRYTSDPVQRVFLGWDEPWHHLREHALATLTAAVLLAAIAAFAAGLGRLGSRVAQAVLLALLAAAAAWLGWSAIHWIFVGRCLLGLAIIHLLWRAAAQDGNVSRTLLAWLGAALMARMVLNGRIYQFGFCQAAVAAMVVPAILIGEVSPSLRRWRAPASALPLLIVALLAPGAVRLMALSQAAWRARIEPVGEGRDRFLAVPPSRDPIGAVVRLVSERLRRTPEADTVVVLPEGEMINYLSRRRSPVAPFFFYSAVTAGGREEDIVRDLQAHPPDWVVIISRDLSEYGIHRYGESPGHGQAILEWVDRDYRFKGGAGGDPLDPHERGAVLLQRTN